MTNPMTPKTKTTRANLPTTIRTNRIRTTQPRKTQPRKTPTRKMLATKTPVKKALANKSPRTVSSRHKGTVRRNPRMVKRASLAETQAVAAVQVVARKPKMGTPHPKATRVTRRMLAAGREKHPKAPAAPTIPATMVTSQVKAEIPKMAARKMAARKMAARADVTVANRMALVTTRISTMGTSSNV